MRAFEVWIDDRVKDRVEASDVRAAAAQWWRDKYDIADRANDAELTTVRAQEEGVDVVHVLERDGLGDFRVVALEHVD